MDTFGSRLRQHLRRVLLRLPLLVLIAYCLYAGALFVAQRHVLFPGQHLEPPSSASA